MLEVDRENISSFHRKLYEIISSFSGERSSKDEVDGEKEQVQMSYSTEVGLVNVCYTLNGERTRVRVNIPGKDEQGNLKDKIDCFIDSHKAKSGTGH